MFLFPWDRDWGLHDHDLGSPDIMLKVIGFGENFTDVQLLLCELSVDNFISVC